MAISFMSFLGIDLEKLKGQPTVSEEVQVIPAQNVVPADSIQPADSTSVTTDTIAATPVTKVAEKTEN